MNGLKSRVVFKTFKGLLAYIVESPRRIVNYGRIPTEGVSKGNEERGKRGGLSGLHCIAATALLHLSWVGDIDSCDDG